jgi:hypothetical protein
VCEREREIGLSGRHKFNFTNLSEKYGRRGALKILG